MNRIRIKSHPREEQHRNWNVDVRKHFKFEERSTGIREQNADGNGEYIKTSESSTNSETVGCSECLNNENLEAKLHLLSEISDVNSGIMT